MDRHDSRDLQLREPYEKLKNLSRGSEAALVIGRTSGTLQRYTLPHISLEHKYTVRCRPQLLALNCNSTKLSIIDINGVLTFFDLDKRVENASGGADTRGEQVC